MSAALIDFATRQVLSARQENPATDERIQELESARAAALEALAAVQLARLQEFETAKRAALAELEEARTAALEGLRGEPAGGASLLRGSESTAPQSHGIVRPSAEELDFARRALRPRSSAGPLFGLTDRDLDLAHSRILGVTAFSGARLMTKRAFDLLYAMVAILLLSPVALFIAIAIKLDSPGPIFFRQTRVGLAGREFGMLKFRTMRIMSHEELVSSFEQDNVAGVLFKVRRDPRITRVGAILRKYSLDELPQLVNVLAGQMSVVGPRPALPVEVRAYEEPVLRRLIVKPGITGLWQVSGRTDLTWEESVRLDLYYVENWSIGTDLRILWRTFTAAVRGGGGY